MPTLLSYGKFSKKSSMSNKKIIWKEVDDLNKKIIRYFVKV